MSEMCIISKEKEEHIDHARVMGKNKTINIFSEGQLASLATTWKSCNGFSIQWLQL